MSDYPDWTDIIQIVGSDIMVPIDLQGAYIMMPVDIQAQYVNLEVDIVAQTIGNIEVDIVASSIGNIDVDINAQSLGDVTIDINAQSIGLQGNPEWAAEAGEGKYLYGTVASVNAFTAGGTIVSYEVPTGKKVVVFGFGGFIFFGAAVAGAHGLQLQLMYSTTTYATAGGYCGFWCNLPVPKVFTAGQTIKVNGTNLSDVTCNLYASLNAREYAV